MTATISTLAELTATVGTRLGPGDWLAVDQDRIQGFADVTGDRQWIHTDVERGRASAFGSTIAHGYLTLSLLPTLVDSVYRLEGLQMAVNYGLDKVRFPAPVVSGSRLRATVDVIAVEESKGGHQLVSAVTIEADTVDRPVCVVTARVLVVF